MEREELRLMAQDCNVQGEILLRAGKAEEARKKFDRAIELCPVLAESYKNYGDLHMFRKEYQEAKNSYRKALLAERSGLLYFLYGNACFLNDEPYEGLENYNRAVCEGYDNAEMMFLMGMAYEYMKDDAMALRYFQKACVKNPSRPDYRIKKIGALVRLGEQARAEKEADELLARAPEVFEAYHLKTQLLLNRRGFDEAAVFAKTAAQRFPEDAELLYDYARALALAGRKDEALQAVRTAPEMKYFAGAKRKFLLLEGQICAEAGDFDRAAECCLQCIEMEKKEGFDGQPHFILMNLYLAGPDYQKALEQAERLIREKREDAYYYAALYYRPFCIRQLGQEEEAKRLYREACGLYRLAALKAPESMEFYLYRALCLKDMGNYAEALEMLAFVEDVCGHTKEIGQLRTEINRLQAKRDEKTIETAGKGGERYGAGL